MDRIATCIGWVAIAAARLETVVAIITVQLLGEDRSDELLGRSWSSMTMRRRLIAYRDLHSSAVESGDKLSARASEAFTTLLHEANEAMRQRHSVLHAVWTADSDVVTRDGASFSFRRRAQDPAYPIRQYLARLDGEVVGTSVAATAPGAVNLFGGSVLAAARGRGVYKAMIRHRWQLAVERNTPALTVQAGRMSQPVLEHVGFRVLGQMRVYRDPHIPD